MDDKYADIRAALEAATPGPWRKGKCFGAVVADKPTGGPSGSDHVEAYGGHLVGESMSPANISYIAACHPEAVGALLAERDALREAVEALLALPSGMYCDGYPEAERKARAALAQENA